jgi:hypothetical protein
VCRLSEWSGRFNRASSVSCHTPLFEIIDGISDSPVIAFKIEKTVGLSAISSSGG